MLAHCRALLAGDDHAEAEYALAIEQLEQCRIAPQLARSHLLYGEWLRRQRRRRDARGHLRTACQMFDTLGMEAFADRARAELRATGERARKRSVQTQDVLTPQETQISRWPVKASPARRSPPGCSSALAPTTTTCAKSSASSGSPTAHDSPTC